MRPLEDSGLNIRHHGTSLSAQVQSGSEISAQLPGAGGAAIPFDPKSATTWGYAQKLLWIVEPGFTGAVTVTARNGSTGKHVYMRSGDTAPALGLFLDPQHPGVPGSGDPHASNPQLRYAEFPTSIFIDAAGCIGFTAAWGTGHWSGTVAAGQGP